jgi:hypothetical protein
MASNKDKKVVKKSQTKSNSEKNVSVTDDKMINEILGNMGKKSKNPVKKELINNFVDGKKKYDIKKQTTSKSAIGDDDKDDKSVGKKTFTDNLTKEEINEKLEDYKLVEDISKVPLGTHLRYFVEKDGIKLFRMGGNLKRNLDLPNFIVLQNAMGVEWTVQIKNTTFYKKMTIKEIKEEYDSIIEDLHDKIKKLKVENKDLKAENKELKKK